MATGLNVPKLANIFRGRLTMMHELSETYKPSITRNKEKLMEMIKGGRLTMMHELSETYKPSITRNKEKLMEMIKEKTEIATKSEFARKMRVLKGFYTVEISPPSRSELEKLVSDIKLAQNFIRTDCFNRLTVRQAWLLFLVCTEVGLWFFLGETIGKGHIVGYLVEP